MTNSYNYFVLLFHKCCQLGFFENRFCKVFIGHDYDLSLLHTDFLKWQRNNNRYVHLLYAGQYISN